MEGGRQRLAQLQPGNISEQRQTNDQVGSPWVKNMKVIKFTGNMKENIAELLTGIECRCGLKKDYSQIINAYGDKITRLRDDRAKHKESLTQEKLKSECLQEQLKKANKMILELEESLMTMHSQTVSREQYQREEQRAGSLQLKLEEMQQGYQMLSDQCKQLQEQIEGYKKNAHTYKRSQNLLLDDDVGDESKDIELLENQNQLMRMKLSSYEQLERQLNMDKSELLQLMRDYANDIPSFSTKEERDLFLLAKKMNSNLWNRKLEMQIKDLHQRREQVRRLELEAKKKSI